MRPGDRVRVSSSDGEGFNGFLQSMMTDCPEPTYREGAWPPGGLHIVTMEVVVDHPPLELGEPRRRPGVTVSHDTGPSKSGKGKKRRCASDTEYPIIEESKMERFTATVIRDPARRSVTIYIEDKDGKFLTNQGERHERVMGAEMPIYTTMPLEIFNAITSASPE